VKLRWVQMTERTVSVPSETKETVYVCEYCAQADTEENVVSYTGTDSYPDMHLHPNCVDSFAIAEMDLEKTTVADIVQKEVKSSHRVAPVLIAGWTDVLVFGLAATCTWLSVESYTNNYYLPMILGLVSTAMILIIALIRMRATATMAAEKL